MLKVCVTPTMPIRAPILSHEELEALLLAPPLLPHGDPKSEGLISGLDLQSKVVLPHLPKE